MDKVHDAIIIGGGPAGAFCAFKLAQEGLDVLIIEARKELKRKVCGEYLCPKGVELLKENRLEDILQGQLPIHGMKIVSPNQTVVQTDFPRCSTDLKGMAINRKIFEEGLLAKCSEQGVDISRGEKVTSFKRDHLHQWSVQTETGQVHRGRLLIGADGRLSFTARFLGLRKSIVKERAALHCHVQSRRPNSRYGEMHIFKDGSYIGINPTGQRELNISLVCPSEAIQSRANLRVLLNNYIEQSNELSKTIGQIPADTNISSVLPITNKVNQFTGQGFALIGDAAGFLDPLTGEGIYNALWMASILSGEIIDARRHDLFNFQSAIDRYADKKVCFFRQKTILNTLFQKIIKWPRIANIIARFLSANKRRGDIFVGIIGNIYSPAQGLLKLLTF